MTNQDNDQTTHKTSTISVGGNVGGSVVTGDNNTTTSNAPQEGHKVWWIKVLEWIISRFNCK
jgi:hypothetical protein